MQYTDTDTINTFSVNRKFNTSNLYNYNNNIYKVYLN